ncbi:MAG: vWA domain-containing protein [Acidilobus sp.]
MKVERGRFLGQALVIAIDTSISMGVKDIRPTRFDAARRGASVIIRSMFGSGVSLMVGLVAFYGHSMPVVDLTGDIEVVERGLSTLGIQGKSTNLSEAIKDAYLMLKWAPAGYRKRIVVITDGDYNEGYEPDFIINLLSYDSIRLDVLLVTEPSSGKMSRLRRLTEATGGKVYAAKSLEEVVKAATMIAYED